MKEDIYKKFLNSRDKEFVNSAGAISDSATIKESSYHEFIASCGGGFYFSGSLHLYENSRLSYHDIQFKSNLVNSVYSQILKQPVVCFGEDLFGNQFVYNGNDYGLLTIETGEIEVLCSSFNDWLEAILDDLNYYTGEPLLLEWIIENKKPNHEERLAPKIPFVLGGDYEVGNLYVSNGISLINFSADIANQIYNTPDGTPVNIKIIP
jgi:hypothetical protein